MSTIRRVAKNTAVLTLADIINKILSMVFVIYLARHLGDAGFGKYSFAFSFANIFMIFADMGLTTLIVRDVARDKSQSSQYLGNIILIKSILAILVFGLIAIVITAMHYPYDTTMAVYIIGFSLILVSFSGSFASIFSAYEQMEYNAVISTLGKIIFVGLGLGAIFLGYGLIPIVSMFLISNIFALMLSVFIVFKKFTKPKFEINYTFWKYLIKNSTPFLLTGIFASIYFYIDTIMLSVMKGDEVVGWYNASYNLLSALIPFTAMFMYAVFPVFSRFFKDSKDYLKIGFITSAKYLFIFALPITVGTTLISENIIYFFYQSEFSNSIIALQILIWAFLFISLNIVLYTLLNSINKQVLVTKATAFGAVINVILNLILIPKMSLIGASIATVITEMSLLFIYYYYASKYLYTLPIPKIIYKPIIAVLFMSGFVLYFRDANIFLVVPIAAFIYFSVLFLIKGFTKNDIEMFRQIIVKKSMQKSF